MASYTEHYQLHQWEPGDAFLRTDFNEDLEKIDAALEDKGNCRIATGSYAGTGEYGKAHPNTIQLPFPAQIVLLDVSTCHSFNSTPEYYLLFRQAAEFMPDDTSNGSNVLTWSDSAVSWYYTDSHSDGPFYQFNKSGQTYQYIIIG